MSNDLHIRLLGEFAVFRAASRLDGFASPRVQSLTAYLLLHRGQPFPRRQLAFLFWPDSTEKQAFTNLRVLIHQLRGALPEFDKHVGIDARSLVWLQESPCALDAAVFEDHVQAANQSQLTGDLESARTELESAVDHYRGDLLPNCYEDWILLHRERMRRSYMAAVDRLIFLLEGNGEYGAAIRHGLAVLRLDPLHEEGYRRLMRLHMLDGDRVSALRIYHTCVTVLERELGVEPAPATVRIYDQLTQADVPELPPSPHATADSVSVSAALVGREDERRQLFGSWRQATHTGVQFVLISGEPGIGKSRLAEDLYVWANHKGIDTARTRAYATKGDLAYAPVIELLRTGSLHRRIERLDDVWLSEITRLLPELQNKHPGLAPPPPLTENWQRQRMFESLARTLDAGASPLLLLIDDLQWCDSETLEWMAYLVRFNPHAHLLILGTARLEEVEAEHQLTNVLHSLRRGERLTEIELASLDVEMTAALGAQAAGRALSVQEADRLYEMTQGNPLFVVETVRAGLDSGSAANGNRAPDQGAAVSLPPKVYDVIQHRVAGVSAQAQSLCGLMAAVGRSFGFDLLFRASSMNEDALVQALDELWRRRLIRENVTDASSDSYDFYHDRVRDVAYAELSPIQRRHYHRQIAGAMEQLQGLDAAASSPELARHYELAGNRSAARDYYLMAGEQALARFVHDEAIGYLDHALALTGPQEAAERFAVHRIRERVYHTRADRVRQQMELDVLATLADALDDDRLRAETALRRCEWALWRGDYGLAVDAAQRVVARAGAVEDVALEADGHTQWAAVLWNQGLYQEARRKLEKALALATASGDRSREVSVLLHLGPLLMYCGTYAEMGDASRQALEAARISGNREGEAWAHNQLAFRTVEQGDDDYAEAEQHYLKALHIVHAIGSRAYEAKVVNNLAALCDRSGRHTEALTLLDQALDIARETDSARPEAFALAFSANANANLGALAAAQDLYERALDIFRRIRYRQGECKTLSEYSVLRHLQGDHHRALVLATEALEIATGMSVLRDQAYALSRQGYALTDLGAPSDAAAAFARALDIYAETGQRTRALEAKAGLARIWLDDADIDGSLALVEEMLAQMAVRPPDAVNETMWVYVTCIRVLDAAGDPRVGNILDSAHRVLTQRAYGLSSGDQRRFWSNVPANREIKRRVADISPACDAANRS